MGRDVLTAQPMGIQLAPSPAWESADRRLVVHLGFNVGSRFGVIKQAAAVFAR